MRVLALAITILLVCGSTAPGVAQPFADTPANHWAYEALAQLAAKGLIQGYPDGTFKGDRTMTRYEMATVVARLLARIESIRIPPPLGAPPQPEVTKEDLDLILQLVHELRAELSDKNVRLAPVEEQLNALRQGSATSRSPVPCRSAMTSLGAQAAAPSTVTRPRGA